MRCAIYTRKSSSEGLQQPFNSLDAQRLSCSHYIASQASEGWVELQTHYDDGGYSGATLVRPALEALLDDVENGAVDVIVVYKIDRLSRSLSDFVHLVGLLERRSVTFTSVTQQFSTTGSMGRLTLNILLSFAQFERDLTSERIRDKFAATRSKGMRPQGGRPFGYQFVDRHLIIEKAEADVVRRIFNMYIRLESATQIPERLDRSGLRNRGGQPFNLSFVRRLLQNRLYRGDLVHKGQISQGVHPSIISEQTWEAVQAVKTRNAERRPRRRRWDCGMLTGLLFGPTGRLLHDGSISRGKVYRYYGPSRKYRDERPQCENGRFRAPDLEQAVLNAIDPHCRLAGGSSSDAAARDLIRSMVERVDIGSDLIITLKTGRKMRVDKAAWLKTSRLQGHILSLPQV